MMRQVDHAVLEGEYVYEGATVWSVRRHKRITVEAIYEDGYGEFYLQHKDGMVAVNNARWENNVEDA